ncbi:hypothetical protein [Paenibacillus sp. PL2-23]|uniref:hypothetical protein n=1 Tax=Paenibacillus sp. PL2-23 TaxID=2100729 RepID=UPI0030F68DE6
MKDELLQLIFEKLNAIELRLDHTATKDDIVNMATKDDIANMATKDDIANMATKDDISELHVKFDGMAAELGRMNAKLDSTFEQVVRNSEMISAFMETAATVNEHTIDIKLLKKAVANY